MSSFITLSQQLLGNRPDTAPREVPVAPPEEIDEVELDRDRAHQAAISSLEEAEAEARAAAKLLRETARALDGMRKRLLDDVRASTAAVILEAARRIAGDALHADHRLLEAIVEEAVRTLGNEGLVIRISPTDHAMLERTLAGSGIRVVEDFFIEAGCICEGPAGSIDATAERAAAGVAAVLDQWK